MEQFAVIHIEKSKGNLTGLGSHIDRTRIPKNADPAKQKLNEHLVGKDKLTAEVNARITSAGCKVRADSVKALSIVLTGSHERMKEIEIDPKQLKAWKEENLKYLTETFGGANIMRFSLHMDERTPHIHAVITPITKDGRLTAKEVVGGPKGLVKLQDEYAKRMEQFGLKRGLENSPATHEDVREYYARVNNPTGKLQRELQIPEKGTFEKKEDYKKRVIVELTPFVEELHHLRRLNANSSERASQAEKVAEIAIKRGKESIVSAGKMLSSGVAKEIKAINEKLKEIGLAVQGKTNPETKSIDWELKEHVQPLKKEESITTKTTKIKM